MVRVVLAVDAEYGGGGGMVDEVTGVGTTLAMMCVELGDRGGELG